MSMTKLSAEEAEDLAGKIDSEGFDYYFTSYGPDEKLQKLIGDEIMAYEKARKNLISALQAIGVEIEP